ncbi:Ig-like domain-containing protein [Wenzhouxiangella sp. EGI_FJ10409]|uniref:Ig-like domain-containing protein n=1 Tax=Wenzhouxiangella sp. EGI_FJ10409 TaxID=3243767 RepID=UPI0035E00063
MGAVNLAETAARGAQDSPISAFDLRRLEFDRGQLWLASVEPIVLQLQQPKNQVGLQVGELHDAIVLVTLHRGDHLVGRQLFADRALPGSRLAVVRDGWMGVESDQAFDRVELSRIEGAGPAVDIESLSLSTDAGARGAGGELACILPLGAAYNVAFGYSITPAPGAYAAAWAAYSANMALKFCKPSLIAPNDIERQVPPGQCEVEIEQPHMAFAYSDALGIPIATQSDWGELGTPQMLHHNTDVDVMLLAGNPWPPTAKSTELDFLLTSASFDASDKIWESCRDDGSVRYSQFEGSGPQYECPYVEDRTLSFSVGYNTVMWRANPRLNPVDLVIPFPGLPSGAKLQPYSGILLEIWWETWFAVLGTQISGWRLPNAQFDFQEVTVFDDVAPTITPMPGSEGNAIATLVGDVLHVTIEADEVGGVSRRRYENILRSFLEVSDACNRPTTLNIDFPSEALHSFWPVSTDTDDNAFFATWTARDPGPNQAGDPNETFASMRIEVLDRQPPSLVPPPDIVEIDIQQVSDLGQAAVFDLVDLSPEVSNSAELPLGPGLHEVVWTAVDSAGNSSQAIQIVNIKASNVPPVALAQTGAGRPDAISFEPTPIRLRGSDADGDPLRFKIESQPENGFFVAPLYPYFIEDFRIEQTASDAELEALCLPDPTGRYELDFPSDPTFFSANDRGDTFVADFGVVECRPPPTVFLRQKRLARFNPDGSRGPTYTNLGSAEFTDVRFDFNSGLVVTTQTLPASSNSNGLIQIYDTDLEYQKGFNLGYIEDTSGNCIPFSVDGCLIRNPRSTVVDALGLIYVMGRTGRIFALEEHWNPSNPGARFVDYLSHDVDNDPATWLATGPLALDADGFVYAARGDRIYKYEPSRQVSPSRVIPGDLVGWLGRCDSDLAPGDQAVCDVGNRRSLGFSCTDEICGVDNAFNAEETAFCDEGAVIDPRSGCRPGQFRGTPQGLDIAPDGTIYVADSGNNRIQRFTPDGFFAGQAKSTGAGSGFVVGDFGSPQNVSVNSSRFYILDPQTNLLHISLLTPFVEIGDDYADLVYQSNNQFACENSADCIDAFSFRVSDGVRDPATGQPEVSAPAEVEVEVSRNFREPFATPGIGAMVVEDVPEAITLDGSDPDPLDTLVFEVVDSPTHGAVSISGNQATYTPDADYWGPDAFSFSVSDGIDTSSPEVVTLEVAEVNDAPIIDLPEEALDAGTGYRFELELSFSDPDPDELHTVEVDWDDGTVESEGEFDADGQPTGPILGHGGTDSGRITADHIFLSSGTKNVEVCITDRMQLDGNDDKVPTPGLSLETCETIAVAVTDAVDLQLTAEPSTDVALPDSFVSYVFDIENLAPQAGSGVTATGVAFSIRLSRGFDPGSVTTPPGCTRNGYRLDCTIGSLAPGQSHDLNVTAQVDGETESGYLLVTEAEAMLDQQPLRSEMSLLLTTPVTRPADYQVGATGDALRDEPDANPGDGQCATGDGVCTLRAAIEEAAEAATPKVIALANGLYLLDDTLEISSDVTLIGNGPDQTRIHGARLVTRPGADTLRIENLTLSGGGMTVGPDSLTIRRVRFTDNEQDFSFGGAIQTTGSVLDIRDSTFDNNRAVDGGSLMCFDCSGVIENVTVTGGSGGGLTFANSGQVALKHLTIVGTSGGAGWSLPNGGALHVYNDMDVTISNSVVAGNYSTGTANNCAVASTASLTSLGNNAFGDLTGCDISPLASDLSITNARLRPLAAGLDGLPVRLPKADSPLIDAFDDASCLATDARGLSRPRDGNDNGIAHCDIGAVERRADRLFSDRFLSGSDPISRQ